MKITRLLRAIIRPHMDDRMGDISTVHRSSVSQTGSRSLSDGTTCILPITTAATSGWHTAMTFWAPGQCTETVSCHSTTRFAGHVASPDVQVDRRAPDSPVLPRCRYCQWRWRPQATRVALSPDGLHFTAGAELLGRPYFRVFQWDDITML